MREAVDILMSGGSGTTGLPLVCEMWIGYACHLDTGMNMSVGYGSRAKAMRWAEVLLTTVVVVAFVAMSMWFGHQRWLECRSEHSWLYCAAFQE